MSLERDENRPALTVVLPAYNEEAALPVTVRTYLETLGADGLGDCEVVLVDDGSRDRTGAVADELARGDRRVRVIHHARNQGLSSAFLDGCRAARGRVITWNGADMPFHPRDVKRMLDEIARGADMVVVERRDRKAYSLRRKIVSWSNVLVLRVLFGSRFHDHNFVQFFRREVFGSMRIVSTGASSVTAEMIFRAVRMGFRVVPVAAEYHQRALGESTITTSKILHTVAETLRLWRRMRAEARRRVRTA